MISDTTVKVSYATDGAQTSFPITFEFSDDSHIEVYLKNDTTGDEEKLTVTTDYSVSGSNVVTVQIYDAGYTLTIVRSHPDTQTLDLEDGGAMPADDLEDRLDRITQILQQHSEKLSRALLLPVTSAYSDLTHPVPEDGKFMIWRDGKLVNVQHYAGADTLILQTFMETFLESITQGAAQTNLGISDFVKTILDDADASAARTTLVALHDAASAVETIHIASGAVTEQKITLADNTTLDVSTSKHGLVPKAPNDTTKFLRGDGTWSALAGSVFVRVTDPETGNIASKTSGWTANSFSGGLTVDFSGYVPAGTKAILVNFWQTGTACTIGARAGSDPEVGDDLSTELSTRLVDSGAALFRSIILLSANLTADFAVTDTGCDLYVRGITGYWI